MSPACVGWELTAVPADPAISELRELFRNLQEFRALYEETGVDEIVTPYGRKWTLWDLEYLLKMCKHLTIRQRQVITLCLVHNMRERDAARAIGVSETNPVMMYATLGLRRLLDLIENGALDRFRQQPLHGHATVRRALARERLVEQIRSRLRLSVKGCWVYPTASILDEPLIRIPSVIASSGFQTVHAARVLYEHYVCSLPATYVLVHKMPTGHYFRACTNPEHFTPEMTSEAKARQHSSLQKYLAGRST
jgi:hypothetical protein